MKLKDGIAKWLSFLTVGKQSLKFKLPKGHTKYFIHPASVQPLNFFWLTALRIFQTVDLFFMVILFLYTVFDKI